MLALVIFLLVAGVVSLLVSTRSRRTDEERASAADSRDPRGPLSGTLAAAADPLRNVVAQSAG